jgi:hypothetical protein
VLSMSPRLEGLMRIRSLCLFLHPHNTRLSSKRPSKPSQGKLGRTPVFRILGWAYKNYRLFPEQVVINREANLNASQVSEGR